ncbi:hypothetical protein PHYSODRAFT_285373 [Phytophthora sojae]|uniref:Elicitin n=1 Tax=Phytophthora sojae (strain P6497) TaxID=1094619 RepID=G4Z4E1_PHYSP|nr:hypothetical protein PHYSODRAFT_285373 [Phytophthora sojae]EGZ20145.1 hypothetical protein PHYSODRAFT_285373 [Phytophthora sojae]|eukprot:XP_009522862.1 hypothetical protein PHYSODRAFT_285373 [Phytophthora sojae]
MDTCDLAAIKTTLMGNETIADKLTTAADKCEADTGVDIFAIEGFPTKETALEFQQSNDGCNVAINIVTSQANINTRCHIDVNGTMVIYGDLVSDFLTGKTGNESESDSASESLSESASGSESESESGSSSTASSNSTSTSDAPTTTLSLVMYGAVAGIAIALR